MGYLVRNPFDFVDTYDVESAERCFDDHEIAAVGAVVRDAEELASRSSRVSRHVPSLTALYALRVAIYTGCRHREELLWGRLDWLKDPCGPISRIEVPRAKGQRGANRGRFLYLGPHSKKKLRDLKDRKRRLVEAFVYRQAIDEATYNEETVALGDSIASTEMSLQDARLDEIDAEAAVDFAVALALNADRMWL